MALKGNHIVIFTGDKSAQIAETLESQSVTKNGFVNMAFDVQKSYYLYLIRLHQRVN